ncbi:MAG: hypothetical protein LBP74_07140 [Treponema sp.]|jgi:hypothetical protein|nr:hypothetical protein [Treponema sp.]
MKKTLGFICLIALICGVVFAQEEGAQEGAAQEAVAQEGPAQEAAAAQQLAAVDPRAAAMAAMMAAEGIKRPGQLALPMGTLTINGMIMTGLQATKAVNPGGSPNDEEWGLMPWDPVWQQNGAKLSLTYNNGKYGGYMQFAAGDWNGTIEEGFLNVYIPNAFIWRSFFEEKFRVSMGMLYDFLPQTGERIWKAEGASEGGWSFAESNMNVSARLEFKPIEGLNVGAQWDFLPFGQTDRDSVAKMAYLAESIKEVGIAGEYKSSLFNIVGGVRFDGADGMLKYDTHTYLKDYYGEAGYVANAQQNTLRTTPAEWIPSAKRPPVWKHWEEVYGTVDEDGIFSTANADKPFEGSYRAIFGFNFKGVKNLTAKMQASFWNLGAWEKFGSGSVDETIAYAITPKFNAGMNFYQDFYGSDAFPDDYVNSPYFRFEPYASYQLTGNVSADLLGTYGIAKDVIESYWRVRPGFTFTAGGFGALRVQLYYEVDAYTWTDKAISSANNVSIGTFEYEHPIYGTISMPATGMPALVNAEGGKPIFRHSVCLSVMWMF